MHRARWLGILTLACVNRAHAQDWHTGSGIELIRRAAAYRTARDADTLLAAWQAEAHGILRYASILDHGAGPVERVIRADELRIEVYGESPNLSKQIIQAWRDTSFLPNRINYHRDHLGIVANDFGATIRLGQGEEVRDVPHPLSQAGLDRYLFALGDTVTVNGPAGKVRVAAVQVRPVNADSAGVVGTLYIDLDRAALVQFRFTFTPASYRDGTVEQITVTLENSLQQHARWLPWRQSITIRRGIEAIDLPVRTVIRGDWTIDNYQLGVHHPPDRFLGPFLVGPRGPIGGNGWDAPIAVRLATLPATDASVNSIEDEASISLGGHSLDGLPRLRLIAGGLSDFVRINSVEGVTPAIGTRLAIGGALVLRGRIGIGLSDHRLIGGGSVERTFGATVWSVSAERSIHDIGDTPVISGLANSLSTAFGGTDFGDYVRNDQLRGGVATMFGRIHFATSIGHESVASVASEFAPFTGSAAANPDLGSRDEWIVRASASQRDLAGYGWSVETEINDRVWARGHVSASGHLPLSGSELQLSGEMGLSLSNGNLPADRSFVLGGRGTLLGVPFRSLGGERMARMEVAWAIPVALPTPPFPYSRWIRLPSTVSPYVAAGIAGGDLASVPWRATDRIEPVAGLRLDLWGPLLRFEAGMSLRSGRIGFAIDAHPDWWGLM